MRSDRQRPASREPQLGYGFSKGDTYVLSIIRLGSLPKGDGAQTCTGVYTLQGTHKRQLPHTKLTRYSDLYSTKTCTSCQLSVPPKVFVMDTPGRPIRTRCHYREVLMVRTVATDLPLDITAGFARWDILDVGGHTVKFRSRNSPLLFSRWSTLSNTFLPYLAWRCSANQGSMVELGQIKQSTQLGQQRSSVDRRRYTALAARWLGLIDTLVVIHCVPHPQL